MRQGKNDKRESMPCQIRSKNKFQFWHFCRTFLYLDTRKAVPHAQPSLHGDALDRRGIGTPCPAPLLVLGATDDGLRTDGEVAATARTYQTNAEFFPNMGHNMMLEPGWPNVAERIHNWLGGQGLYRNPCLRL